MRYQSDGTRIGTSVCIEETVTIFEGVRFTGYSCLQYLIDSDSKRYTFVRNLWLDKLASYGPKEVNYETADVSNPNTTPI